MHTCPVAATRGRFRAPLAKLPVTNVGDVEATSQTSISDAGDHVKRKLILAQALLDGLSCHLVTWHFKVAHFNPSWFKPNAGLVRDGPQNIMVSSSNYCVIGLVAHCKTRQHR
ncbi:protein of unknown function [Caballeronia sp. S22]